MNAHIPKFALVHGGPMHKWFDLLPQSPSEVLDPVEGLQTAFRSKGTGFSRGFKVTNFVDWDLYRLFPGRPLHEIRQHILHRYGATVADGGANQSVKRIVVLGRDASSPELDAHPVRAFGPRKRNIPNMSEAVEHLRKDFSVEFLDGTVVPPDEMIRKCSSADVLLGQHGAGLANALFVPRGKHIVEIGWYPAGPAQAPHFRELSRALTLNWSYLHLQKSESGSVDGQKLRIELRKVLCGQEGSDLL